VNILSIPQIVLLGDAFAIAITYIAGDHSDTHSRKLYDLSMLPFKINVPGLRQGRHSGFKASEW
jgi:hypothetical protein